jgi:hypothetical protein
MSKPSLALFVLLSFALYSHAQDHSSEEVARRAVQRCAAQAVVWGMPAVNFDLMLQAAIKNNGAANQIVYWSHLPSWKNQTLTPNPDAIYLMPFINTKEGPIVLEIPPADEGSITGSIDDAWQTAVEDVGPAGLDQGKGGKYVILPPDRKFKLPDGYIPLSPATFQSYALLRSILKSGSDTDVAKAVAYGRRVKLYPLSQANAPPDTKFVDVVDDVYDTTIPYDMRFFDSLNRIVQTEPWLDRDRVMIDCLKTLGIEKGKPYRPSDEVASATKHGMDEAHAWVEVNYEKLYVQPFNPGIRWALPASPELVKAMESNFGDPDSYPVDTRGLSYSLAFFSAKHLGAGQYYLMTINDKEGKTLEGSHSYRLTVPANAPVKQYWSATVYNRATHAFIRDARWMSRSSQTPGLQKNLDGSVDVFFAPKPPTGKESNWVPTDADGQFEVLFRFYGPDKSLFDKRGSSRISKNFRKQEGKWHV